MCSVLSAPKDIQTPKLQAQGSRFGARSKPFPCRTASHYRSSCSKHEKEKVSNIIHTPDVRRIKLCGITLADFLVARARSLPFVKALELDCKGYKTNLHRSLCSNYGRERVSNISHAPDTRRLKSSCTAVTDLFVACAHPLPVFSATEPRSTRGSLALQNNPGKGGFSKGCLSCSNPLLKG